MSLRSLIRSLSAAQVLLCLVNISLIYLVKLPLNLTNYDSSQNYSLVIILIISFCLFMTGCIGWIIKDPNNDIFILVVFIIMNCLAVPLGMQIAVYTLKSIGHNSEDENYLLLNKIQILCGVVQSTLGIISIYTSLNVYKKSGEMRNRGLATDQEPPRIEIDANCRTPGDKPPEYDDIISHMVNAEGLPSYLEAVESTDKQKIFTLDV